MWSTGYKLDVFGAIGKPRTVTAWTSSWNLGTTDHNTCTLLLESLVLYEPSWKLGHEL
jgi:hypothetical protein